MKTFGRLLPVYASKKSRIRIRNKMKANLPLKNPGPKNPPLIKILLFKGLLNPMSKGGFPRCKRGKPGKF